MRTGKIQESVSRSIRLERLRIQHCSGLGFGLGQSLPEPEKCAWLRGRKGPSSRALIVFKAPLAGGPPRLDKSPAQFLSFTKIHIQQWIAKWIATCQEELDEYLCCLQTRSSCRVESLECLTLFECETRKVLVIGTEHCKCSRWL